VEVRAENMSVLLLGLKGNFPVRSRAASRSTLSRGSPIGVLVPALQSASHIEQV
jgi:hypothetical protein